jgi:topoisomerase IA-like protein
VTNNIDQILKTCPDAPLMVRDHRAATYIKVGDLTAALRDGRKMIQEAEQNCIVGLAKLNSKYAV